MGRESGFILARDIDAGEVALSVADDHFRPHALVGKNLQQNGMWHAPIDEGDFFDSRS